MKNTREYKPYVRGRFYLLYMWEGDPVQVGAYRIPNKRNGSPGVGLGIVLRKRKLTLNLTISI